MVAVLVVGTAALVLVGAGGAVVMREAADAPEVADDAGAVAVLAGATGEVHPAGGTPLPCCPGMR
ncbi:MAG: hypothetical protein M0032_07060, partial [Actinomycetota bacterium]|nr:hypothetical protein [Actinomycetota bacterium]